MTKKAAAASSQAQQVDHDHSDYPAFLTNMQSRFESIVADMPQLFTVNTPNLWEVYLNEIPAAYRQHNTCNACRRFVEQFGNLVVIDAEGRLLSPIWHESDAAAENRQAVRTVRAIVESCKVNGVFVPETQTWGTPKTGDWTHMALIAPQSLVYRPGLLNASQRTAELLEHHRILNEALNAFKPQHLEQALTILQAEALSRSEKFVGVVEWLIARQAERKGPNGANLIWRAVASAPVGFCTPRSSMVGTLLEDLASGMRFEDVKRRFDAKMHPLSYQRPTAPPAAGNIKQAEEAFAKLGLSPSLQRRFALVADVQEFVWQPKAQETPAEGGLFGHLKAKDAPPVTELNLPAKAMTWTKFAATVLPTAEKVEVQVPYSGSFGAFVTAADADAPPIIQWDREDQRNAVTWYLYPRGSTAGQWGVRPGYVEVVGITPQPNQWNGGPTYIGEGVLFILPGAKDTGAPGLGLFPEFLRSDLHAVRSTIEAYSKGARIAEPEGQRASGLLMQKNQSTTVTVRVTSKGATAVYTLDRWD